MPLRLELVPSLRDARPSNDASAVRSRGALRTDDMEPRELREAPGVPKRDRSSSFPRFEDFYRYIFDNFCRAEAGCEHVALRFSINSTVESLPVVVGWRSRQTIEDRPHPPLAVVVVVRLRSTPRSTTEGRRRRRPQLEAEDRSENMSREQDRYRSDDRYDDRRYDDRRGDRDRRDDRYDDRRRPDYSPDDRRGGDRRDYSPDERRRPQPPPGRRSPPPPSRAHAEPEVDEFGRIRPPPRDPSPSPDRRRDDRRRDGDRRRDSNDDRRGRDDRRDDRREERRESSASRERRRKERKERKREKREQSRDESTSDYRASLYPPGADLSMYEYDPSTYWHVTPGDKVWWFRPDLTLWYDCRSESYYTYDASIR